MNDEEEANPGESDSQANPDPAFYRLQFERLREASIREAGLILRHLSVHVPKENLGPDIAALARLVEEFRSTLDTNLERFDCRGSRLDLAIENGSYADVAFAFGAHPFPEEQREAAQELARTMFNNALMIAECVTLVLEKGDWGNA